MESRILNFTVDISTRSTLKGPLKMILWAGDCVHNGITDVERLPGYDVYLCFGFIQTLQPNIDYMYRRESGNICIVDASSDEQMGRFIKEFKGRFSHIDSDYHGNTPMLKPEYYSALLCKGGKAYNVEGINGVHIYRGDYVNILEIFAPILTTAQNEERRFTENMIKLAKDNDLSVDMAWASPDLSNPCYDEIRDEQLRFLEYRKSLNPKYLLARIVPINSLEEYWSQLSVKVLACDLKKAEESASALLEDLFGESFERFVRYIIQRVDALVDDVSEFRSSVRDFKKIQELLKSSEVASKFTGLTVHYSSYIDMRRYKEEYGLWLEKP